jgi:hypothetical protein
MVTAPFSAPLRAGQSLHNKDGVVGGCILAGTILGMRACKSGTRCVRASGCECC